MTSASLFSFEWDFCNILGSCEEGEISFWILDMLLFSQSVKVENVEARLKIKANAFDSHEMVLSRPSSSGVRYPSENYRIGLHYLFLHCAGLVAASTSE